MSAHAERGVDEDRTLPVVALQGGGQHVDDPLEHPTRVVRAQSETAAVMVCRMASSDDGCAGRGELGRSCSAGAS